MCKTLPVDLPKDAKMDAKFLDGVYLGISQRNSEYFIGTPEGVFGSRTIKRFPYEERLNFEFIDKVKGVPWLLRLDPETAVDIKISPEIDLDMPEPSV